MQNQELRDERMLSRRGTSSLSTMKKQSPCGKEAVHLHTNFESSRFVPTTLLRNIPDTFRWKSVKIEWMSVGSVETC